jgi:hypothetical protein
LGKLKVPDRLPRFLKEDVVVIDISGSHETRAQAELTFQNDQRPRAELDATVITSFGYSSVDTRDARLVDTDDAVNDVEVGYGERDLLGRPQPWALPAECGLHTASRP